MREPQERSFRSGPSLFCREGVVALHTWASQLQDVRGRWLLDLQNEQPYVVRAQTLYVDPRANLPLNADVVVRCVPRVGQVKGSSFEFLIDMYSSPLLPQPTAPPAAGAAQERLVGHSLAVGVSVNKERTKTAPVHPDFHKFAHNEPHPLRSLSAGLLRMRRNVDETLARSPHIYRHPIVVRYSDEDALRHTNQAGYLRFFFEAISALRADDSVRAQHPELASLVATSTPLAAVTIDYLKETTVRMALWAAVEPSPPRPPSQQTGPRPVIDCYIFNETTIFSRAQYFVNIDDDGAPAKL